MLYMCFHIGELRYALEARSIESVIPRVELQPCTELNTSQVGSLLYKQQLLPVFDLCQILRHQPAKPALSTRILILTDDTGSYTRCGIIVEQATGTIRLDERPTSLPQHEAANSLAETVHTDSDGTLQLINSDKLMAMLLNTAGHHESKQSNANHNFQTGPTR